MTTDLSWCACPGSPPCCESLVLRVVMARSSPNNSIDLCIVNLYVLQVAYDLLSPLHAARDLPPNIAAFLPPSLLLHGTADKSVPVSSSLLLADALQAAGATARVHLLPGKTHTDLLLEDAMAGGRDVLTDSILEVITGQERTSNYPCMCPKPLVRLAGWICPF